MNFLVEFRFFELMLSTLMRATTKYESPLTCYLQPSQTDGGAGLLPEIGLAMETSDRKKVALARTRFPDFILEVFQ